MIQTDIDVLQGLLKRGWKILQKVLSQIPRFPERKNCFHLREGEWFRTTIRDKLTVFFEIFSRNFVQDWSLVALFFWSQSLFFEVVTDVSAICGSSPRDLLCLEYREIPTLLTVKSLTYNSLQDPSPVCSIVPSIHDLWAASQVLWWPCHPPHLSSAKLSSLLFYLQDPILAEVLQRQHPKWITRYHEHDILLENIEGEKLSEDERQQAWSNYEAEKDSASRNQGT